jgi:hypothetical protein
VNTIPLNILSFSGYNYEGESNTKKARAGTYIRDNLYYIRRSDLEGVDSHLFIVDVMGSKQLHIINVYRCFNPQDGSAAREKFISQLLLIKSAFVPGTIIMGDFNLDANKQFQANYTHKMLFEDLKSHSS